MTLHIKRMAITTATTTLFALFLAASACPARAQTAESGPSLASRKTIASIRDLDLLPSLTPLRLTQPQADALAKALADVKDATEARLKKQDAALAALADDVEKTRAAMLNGEPLPEELRAKIAALGKEFADENALAKRKAVADVLAVVKAELNADQKNNIQAQIEKFLGGKRVPKEFAKDPSKAPVEVVQDLALSAYVDRVLLDERTPDLLAKMKPAPAAAPPAASDAPTLPPAAPAPAASGGGARTE